HLARDQRQATPIHGIGNAVSANTDHPEAAAAFLAFRGGERAAIIQAEAGTANVGISRGWVLTGGMNTERSSWPGMIRGVEARIDPAEGAPFRCLTVPRSSTLVRAWMSLRSRRSRTRVRCC